MIMETKLTKEDLLVVKQVKEKAIKAEAMSFDIEIFKSRNGYYAHILDGYYEFDSSGIFTGIVPESFYGRSNKSLSQYRLISIIGALENKKFRQASKGCFTA